MHSNFGEWYHDVSLTASNDDLKKRWTAVVAASVERNDVLHLIQLAFSEAPPATFLGKFRSGFREADETFPLHGNEAEMGVLASATLIHLLGRNRDDAGNAEILAAVGCVAADLGGLRRKQCINPELIKHAYAYLRSAATTRADWKPMDTVEEPTPVQLKQMLAVVAEESNILWWLFGQCSRDSGKPFSSFPVHSLALVAGKELSDLTRVAPGSGSIAAILSRALSEGKGKADTEIELDELARVAPSHWDVSPTTLPDGWLSIAPMRSVVRASREGIGGPQTRAQLGLKKGVKLNAANVALQIYWEFQWERAWNRG